MTIRHEAIMLFLFLAIPIILANSLCSKICLQYTNNLKLLPFGLVPVCSNKIMSAQQMTYYAQNYAGILASCLMTIVGCPGLAHLPVATNSPTSRVPLSDTIYTHIQVFIYDAGCTYQVS